MVSSSISDSTMVVGASATITTPASGRKIRFHAYSLRKNQKQLFIMGLVLSCVCSAQRKLDFLMMHQRC